MPILSKKELDKTVQTYPKFKINGGDIYHWEKLVKCDYAGEKCSYLWDGITERGTPFLRCVYDWHSVTCPLLSKDYVIHVTLTTDNVLDILVYDKKPTSPINKICDKII